MIIGRNRIFAFLPVDLSFKLVPLSLGYRHDQSIHAIAIRSRYSVRSTYE
jgi:hypothetical protein